MHIVEAGIDYLTLHTPMWSDKRPATPQEVISAYQDFTATYAPLPFMRLLGYEGYGDNFFFVGEREDGYLRRIAGAASDALFPQTFVFGDLPSRLDVQVTVSLDDDVNQTIQTHKAEATVSNLALPQSRRRNIEEHSDNRDGMTVYIGSRQSQVFGRMYNKYAKSKEERYKGCIRYEVQLMGEYAHVWAAALHLAGERRHRTCVSYVKEWFEAKGVATLIKQPSDRQIPPPIHAAPPSIDKTMLWLKKQVSPALKRLLQEVDRDVVLDALGIADPGNPDELAVPVSPD